MKNYSMFDVIGPRMIGPSSSHTAGAARLSKVARKIGGEEITQVTFYLHGSFAKTYKGHGTDRALVAGIQGMEPNDENLRNAMEIALDKGISFEFIEADLGEVHPNTVKIVMKSMSGKTTEVIGSSVGGGNIKIFGVNGLDVEFTGEYPTLLIRHIDKPGAIAKVSLILSEYDINIAFMRVFRQSKGKDAFMIIETDNQINEEVIGRTKALGEDFISVYLIDAL